ncbi:MAG: hypothetical protein QOE10_3035 [Gaiellales bacterium]|nr:hypothetical protein [Gaiellales bacterium]
MATVTALLATCDTPTFRALGPFVLVLSQSLFVKFVSRPSISRTVCDYSPPVMSTAIVPNLATAPKGQKGNFLQDPRDHSSVLS